MAVFGAYKYRISPTRLKLSLELRFFCHFQEIHSASWLLFISTTRWFGFRLDLLCAIFVTFVAFLSVAGKFAVARAHAIALRCALLLQCPSLDGWQKLISLLALNGGRVTVLL